MLPMREPLEWVECFELVNVFGVECDRHFILQVYRPCQGENFFLFV